MLQSAVGIPQQGNLPDLAHGQEVTLQQRRWPLRLSSCQAEKNKQKEPRFEDEEGNQITESPWGVPLEWTHPLLLICWVPVWKENTNAAPKDSWLTVLVG